MNIEPRWQNQEEAFQFALGRPSVMFNMGMGTGKTRTAIDVAFAREDVHKILVVCPKSILVDKVWEKNLQKFHPEDHWECISLIDGTIIKKAQDVTIDVILADHADRKVFVVVNYDIVWRADLGDALRRVGFDLVILDESHRAKSAGSKVSKYLHLLGKHIPYKMCLSGTPMANSPLDVYGQYRFLDPTIFGTRYDNFKERYAVLGGPERRFIVGFKNLKELDSKFDSIAYTCKMSDIREELKLPPELPPIERGIYLSKKDMNALKELKKEFMAEYEQGVVAVKNVLGVILRQQQITSGFCMMKDGPNQPERMQELNTVKKDQLVEDLQDISPKASVVVFCVFRHDLDAVHVAAREAKRDVFEVSGTVNELEVWRTHKGAVLAVQVQAGAEGIDLTLANHAIYFSLPALSIYEQSRARLYRPNQTRPVSFIHYLARGTIDELIYDSLIRKRNLIDDIQAGAVDFGRLK